MPYRNDTAPDLKLSSERIVLLLQNLERDQKKFILVAYREWLGPDELVAVAVYYCRAIY